MDWFGSRRAAPTELSARVDDAVAALLVAGGARAAGAGYWHTSGNRILDSANQPVRIASINWYGFETTTFVAHGLWIADYKAILNLIKSSGFNAVRIPYSDQMVSQNPVLGTMNINRNGINTDIAGGRARSRRAGQDHRPLRHHRPARDSRQSPVQRRQFRAGKRTVVHQRVPREHLAGQLARAHHALQRQHHGHRHGPAQRAACQRLLGRRSGRLQRGQ